MDIQNLVLCMIKNDNPIPYFEIYPAPDSDTRRYFLNETEEMMNNIRKVLNG